MKFNSSAVKAAGKLAAMTRQETVEGCQGTIRQINTTAVAAAAGGEAAMAHGGSGSWWLLQQEVDEA